MISLSICIVRFVFAVALVFALHTVAVVAVVCLYFFFNSYYFLCLFREFAIYMLYARAT